MTITAADVVVSVWLTIDFAVIALIVVHYAIRGLVAFNAWCDERTTPRCRVCRTSLEIPGAHRPFAGDVCRKCAPIELEVRGRYIVGAYRSDVGRRMAWDRWLHEGGSPLRQLSVDEIEELYRKIFSDDLDA
jgi:hypothetical protein